MAEQIGGNNEANKNNETHWVVKFVEHLKCLWNEDKATSRPLYFSKNNNYARQLLQSKLLGNKNPSAFDISRSKLKILYL